MTKICRFYVNIEYEDDITDPDAISEMLNSLIDTGLSTDGITEVCGNPQISYFDFEDDEEEL